MRTFLDHRRCFGQNRFGLLNSEGWHSGGNGSGLSDLTPYRTGGGLEDYYSLSGRYGGADLHGVERKARRSFLR